MALLVVWCCSCFVHAESLQQKSGFPIGWDHETGSISTVLESGPDVSLIELTVIPDLELITQTQTEDELKRPIILSTFTNSVLRVDRKLILNPDGHTLNIEYLLTNISLNQQTITLTPGIHFASGFTGMEDTHGGLGASLFNYLDPFIAGSIHPIILDDPLKAGLSINAKDWFGWINRYYVVAISPEKHAWNLVQDNTEAEIQFSPDSLHMVFPVPIKIEPSRTFEIGFRILLTPKLMPNLSGEKLDGLLFVDLWRWFRAFCLGLWTIITAVYSICGDWGLSIIVLAVMVKVLTIPITNYSLKYQQIATNQQARIKPLLVAYKQQYSGLELSEQIVDLYAREKYQQAAPFKSLIAIAIQIPILIALFNILGNVYEFHGSSFLWIEDLALSDRVVDMGISIPYFGNYLNALPLLMGLVTMFAVLQGSKNASKWKSAIGLGCVFAVLFYSFPAALVLYWMTANIIQLAQQIITQEIQIKHNH